MDSLLRWLPEVGRGSLPVTCPVPWDISPCLQRVLVLSLFRGDGSMLSDFTVIVLNLSSAVWERN